MPRSIGVQSRTDKRSRIASRDKTRGALASIRANWQAVAYAPARAGADIYYGLGDLNSDLATQRLSAQDFTGVQPSVGDSANRYQGWADGYPDLFNPTNLR